MAFGGKWFWDKMRGGSSQGSLRCCGVFSWLEQLSIPLYSNYIQQDLVSNIMSSLSSFNTRYINYIEFINILNLNSIDISCLNETFLKPIVICNIFYIQFLDKMG